MDGHLDVGRHEQSNSEDQDLDLVWGLLEGSASNMECEDGGRFLLESLDGSSVVAACLREDFGDQLEEVEERSNDKQLALSIISFSPWQRVGRFPFTLSSSSEASILCMTPFTYQDRLQAQLYDEDSKKVCETGLVAMTDDDWVCLNYVDTGGDNVSSSRLLSCMKDCGNGWSVCFDVKELTEEGCVSYVMRFVRVAKSRLQLPLPGEQQELCQSFATPLSSTAQNCLDCTDADEHNEATITSSKLVSGVVLRASLHDMLVGLAQLDDTDLPAQLLDPSFWSSMSRGVSVRRGVQRAHMDIGTENLRKTASVLQQSGYSSLQNLAWEDAGISLESVALTMESLSERGFPPVFIFMYDEPWLLFETLFIVMANILGCDAVEMDTSVFAWALQPSDGRAVVGSNFGRPHRDCAYDACHSAGGEPNALSVWMPVVPVTIDSGCMYVVPSDHDPLFDKPSDHRHMCPDQQMPWAHIQPLPCSAGDVLIWHGNLIHWGSACSKNVMQPRKSIATTFRVACDATKTRKGMLSHADLRTGLSMQSRLRIIIVSLLGYEHWHPGFAGLSGLKDSVK